MSQEKKFQIVATKANNGATVKCNNYLLHSMYNPESEALKFADKHYQAGYLHVLYGVGLGYIALELQKKMSDNDFLLILEPEQEIIDEVLKSEQFKKTLDLENVQMIHSQDREYVKNQLLTLFRKYKGKYALITSLNYDKAFPENYTIVTELFKELMVTEIINLNTENLFAQDWQVNLIHNLYTGFEATPLNKLKHISSCPVVIASGGPSLMKQIALLKQHRDKFLLVCAGTTISTLLRERIIPDLVVSVDGSLDNYKHFKGLQVDAPLAFSFPVYEKIPKEYNGEKLIFQIPIHPSYNELIAEIYGFEMATIEQGPSVANICLKLAQYISNGPVCLIGQDLAYTNNQSHAEGNANNKQVDEDFVKARKMLYIQGYYGEQILTDYPFLSMKRWFERYVKSLANAEHIFNCTEGGAKIEGMNQMPFAQYIDVYCKKGEEIPQIKEIMKENKRNYEEWMNFYRVIVKISKNLKSAQKIASEAFTELFTKKDFTPKLLKKLDQYDKNIAECMKDNFLYLKLTPLVNSITYGLNNIEQKTEKEKRRILYDKSLHMYRQIDQSVSEILPHINEILSKLENRLHVMGEKGEEDHE